MGAGLHTFLWTPDEFPSEETGVVDIYGWCRLQKRPPEVEEDDDLDRLSDQSVARTENEKILATNASSEAPLERQKMIILFMKIRLLSLQSRAICN